MIDRNTKKCPHPRCLARIDKDRFCCDHHWTMTPRELTERAARAFDHTQRTGDRSEHLAAIRAIERHWYEELKR